MDCRMSLTYGHASSLPPGMMDGPYRAPSSPPDTPVPMNRKPFSARYLVRLFESGKWELPPSMMMSPGSAPPSVMMASMKSSTALPAYRHVSLARGELPCEAYLNKQHHAPRLLKLGNELFQAVCTNNGLALSFVCEEAVDYRRSAHGRSKRGCGS
jgi:hypothetical protein